MKKIMLMIFGYLHTTQYSTQHIVHSIPFDMQSRSERERTFLHIDMTESPIYKKEEKKRGKKQTYFCNFPK